MKENKDDALSDCWDSLMRLYDTIPDKEKDKYAFPYLVNPPESYFSSPFKVLVLGKETNGWGDKERCQWDKQNYKEELKQLYRCKACCIFNSGMNSSFWNFFHLLKKGSENCQEWGKVSFVAANVALLGYKYGDNGFNPELININEKLGLAYSLGLLYKALTPDMILLTIGSDIKNGNILNYLRILKDAKILPKNDTIKGDIKNITPEGNKVEIKIFELQSTDDTVKIFMTRHPQGCSYSAISDFITKEIENEIILRTN